MKKAWLFLLITSNAFANLHLAPPDFDSKYGRAIHVDFKKAEYDITFDLDHQTASVKSKITFESAATGKPIFDLIPKPENIKINGHKIRAFEITLPGNISRSRILSASVNPGIHVMEMENEFSRNVIFDQEWGHVFSAFWIRDLKDRMFLEQYIPSNFEYDQYKIVLNINVVGLDSPDLDFFVNGQLTRTSAQSWRVEYPEFYTVSCPYFHMTPKGFHSRLDFNYRSVSGKNIPITVYSNWKSRTRKFKAETIKVMQELEADYGAWGHDFFIAYGTMPGTGGMEHAGATATSFGALDHEMLHSYFAKGVMPANGNSGWIDEAIASWRDRGYLRNPSPGFEGSNLGAHSIYKRNTDDRAYGLGSAFMAYLDWRLQNSGGLKAFLRGYFQAYKHQVITTEHFKNNLEFFSGLNFDKEFSTLIWGKNTPETQNLKVHNPNHRPLSPTELKSLL